MNLFSISMLMSVSSPVIYLLIMRASGAGSEGLGWRWHCSFGISAWQWCSWSVANLEFEALQISCCCCYCSSNTRDIEFGFNRAMGIYIFPFEKSSKMVLEAGEMGQWIRTLSVFTEDPIWFSVPTVLAHIWL